MNRFKIQQRHCFLSTIIFNKGESPASTALKNKIKIGIAISILGSILIVIHAPKRNTVNTFDDLRLHLESPEFISFVFVLGLAGKSTQYLFYLIQP